MQFSSKLKRVPKTNSPLVAQNDFRPSFEMAFFMRRMRGGQFVAELIVLRRSS